MTDLPAPLTPADCDLKDFPHTPIYRARLRGSTFNAKANDAEWRAGVNLWLNAQDQVPAGSLPDDDLELCRLADLGRDVKAWKKVKAWALHKWFKCSDGRLYNETVAEIVNMQWQAKIDQRNKTLKARIAALQKRLEQATDQNVKTEITEQIQRMQQGLKQWQSQSLSQSGESSVTEPGSLCDRDQEKRREGEGKGLVVPFPSGNAVEGSEPGKPEWWPKRDRYGRVVSVLTDKIVFDVGKAVLGKSAGGQVQRLLKCYGHDLRAAADFLLQAEEKSDPRQWFAGVLKRAELDERADPKHVIYPEAEYRA
jgi:hypothetical protein